MQNAEVVLSMLGQKSAQESTWVFDRLYRNFFNQDFFMLAYNNIYAKEGNMTEGVDGSTIDGFNTATVLKLIERLKTETYSPKPVRRTYIPKKNGTLQPLGIPIGLSYCLSFPAMFGIPMIANGVDQKPQPTFLVLLYHVLLRLSILTRVPMVLGWLAKLRDAFWSEGNPTWSMRHRLHILQAPRFTPVRNG
jgi:hypothetical protein